MARQPEALLSDLGPSRRARLLGSAGPHLEPDDHGQGDRGRARTTTRSSPTPSQAARASRRPTGTSSSPTSLAPSECCGRCSRRATAGTASSRSRCRRALPTTPRAPSSPRGTCTSGSRKPNLLVKIPATREGLPAIKSHDRRGSQHQRDLDLLPRALPRGRRGLPVGPREFVSGGGDASKVASVASFFVSRVDTEVDRRLEADRQGPPGHAGWCTRP